MFKYIFRDSIPYLYKTAVHAYVHLKMKHLPIFFIKNKKCAFALKDKHKTYKSRLYKKKNTSYVSMDVYQINKNSLLKYIFIFT